MLVEDPLRVSVVSVGNSLYCLAKRVCLAYLQSMEYEISAIVLFFYLHNQIPV